MSCFFQNLRWPSVDVVIKKSVLQTNMSVTVREKEGSYALGSNAEVDYISMHETLVVLVRVR